MTDTQRLIDELTTFDFFKNDPDIAAKIVAPPPPGSKRHKKARAVAKKTRDSAQELSRTPLDPFGRLAEAILRLMPQLIEIEDATNPNDPLVLLRRALTILQSSVARLEERVVGRDPGAEFDEFARRFIHVAPLPETVSWGKTTGYKVNVDGVRNARQQIHQLAARSTGDDVRLAVALAFEHLLTTLLLPVHKHLTDEQAGTTLFFHFDADPEKYGYVQKRALG